MNEAEQRALFERTRAQIQQNVAEITELARTAQHPGQFFNEFIKRAVTSLAGEGGAVWASNGEEFQVLAEQNLASSLYHENDKQRSDIHRVLRDVSINRRPFIVPAVQADIDPLPIANGEEEVGNATPHPFFYVPILLGEKVAAVLQLWLPRAGDPKTYRDLVAFLTSICIHASTFLKNRQGEMAVAKNQDLEMMLRLQEDLLGELDEEKAGLTVVNHLMDLLRVNRCCLFRNDGKKWRLLHASNQEAVDEKSVLVQTLSKLAGLLPESKEGQLISPKEAPDDGAWRQTWEDLGGVHGAYVHFHPGAHHRGPYLILVEKNQEPAPTAAVPHHLKWVAAQYTRALGAISAHREVPFRTAGKPVAAVKRMWRQNQRVRLACWTLLPLAIIALWFILPWQLKISGDCMVVPKRQAVVTTESGGRVQQVFVTEGQIVKKGDLLAKLDDQDLVTQIAVSTQDKLKWQVETSRSQATGNEGDRKLAEINMQRAVETLNRLDYLRGKTELRAPIDGTILTKNLQNREGESLEPGKPFLEMAAQDLYEVVVDVKQEDLGVLLEEMDRGEKLPVEFILNSYAQARLKTFLVSKTEVSQVADIKQKGSFFAVRATFPVGSELADKLKPGYTGKAKIFLRRHSLAYVMMRKFLIYWRVEWAL